MFLEKCPFSREVYWEGLFFVRIMLFIHGVSTTLQQKILYVAESGFDPPTSGLWAQHASSAPLC